MEGNEGLSLMISVFSNYLLYALKCEVYSCRHVLHLYINRNKNSLYKKDKINRMNIAVGTFEVVCGKGWDTTAYFL